MQMPVSEEDLDACVKTPPPEIPPPPLESFEVPPPPENWAGINFIRGKDGEFWGLWGNGLALTLTLPLTLTPRKQDLRDLTDRTMDD